MISLAMNITFVNNCDLPGRIFNGYELHKSLNESGHNSNQIVLEKTSKDNTVIPLLSDNEMFVRRQLMVLERRLSMNDAVYPYAQYLMDNCYFKDADIVHYQFIHNNCLDICDLKKLALIKKSVWTIHDPWVITGHCVHPLSCNNWETGCESCDNLDDAAFPLNVDKAGQLWRIKQEALENLDIDLVVASDFMIKYLQKSPITCNLNKIHKIPFGIDLNKISLQDKESAKNKFGIGENNAVIGFRCEDNKLKGVKFIEDMLMKFPSVENITLLTVGDGQLSKEVKDKFKIIELGWQDNADIMDDFYNATDIFLMPSLAESFGMMAIEAMAHECTVVVFKETVLEEITFSPDCGVAVEYKDSNALYKAVEGLLNNRPEVQYRGRLGRELVNRHYRYENYVSSHVKLYEEILSKNK